MAKPRMIKVGARKVRADNPDDSVIIRAYRRMIVASSEGRGVILSAEEVLNIVRGDDAVLTAVQSADEEPIPF